MDDVYMIFRTIVYSLFGFSPLLNPDMFDSSFYRVPNDLIGLVRRDDDHCTVGFLRQRLKVFIADLAVNTVHIRIYGKN